MYQPTMHLNFFSICVNIALFILLQLSSEDSDTEVKLGTIQVSIHPQGSVVRDHSNGKAMRRIFYSL